MQITALSEFGAFGERSAGVYVGWDVRRMIIYLIRIMYDLNRYWGVTRYYYSLGIQVITVTLSSIKNLPHTLPTFPLSINVLQPIPCQHPFLRNIKVNIPTFNRLKVYIPHIAFPRKVYLRPRLNHFVPIILIAPDLAAQVYPSNSNTNRHFEQTVPVLLIPFYSSRCPSAGRPGRRE
jgi:hypothetical protein